MQARFDVVEYLLTSKAGLTHRDIHGEDRSGYHVRRRHDVTATVRRTLARVGRRRFAMSVATFFTGCGVTAMLAGLEWAGAFIHVVGVAIAASIVRYAPDVAFERPAPTATVTKSSVDGLTQDEINRRLLIHTKREEVKEEKIEKRRKRQERKQKVRGGP